MEYNIFSKVDSLGPTGETIEAYLERKAKRVTDTLLPENELPPDSPRKSGVPESTSTTDTSGALVSSAVCPDDDDRKYTNIPECCLRNFIKGFTFAFSSRVVVQAMTTAVYIYRSRDKKTSSPLKHFLQMGGTPFQYGMVLGSILGGQNSMVYATRHAKGNLARYRFAIAGAVSAFGIVFAPRGPRRTISLVIFVRALEVLAKLLVEKKVVSPVPFSDVLLMSLASARVMWCWIFEPHNVDDSYLGFLNRIGGKPVSFLRTAASVYMQQPLDLALVNKDRQRLGMQLLPTGKLLSLADVVYRPGESSLVHFCRYTVEGCQRTVKVYLPVHLLPLLLFNFHLLLRKPVGTIANTALGITRSSVFLALYCALGWVGFEAAEALTQRPKGGPARSHATLKSVGHFAGAFCGLSLGIEKPGRRIELALYTFTQAIRTVFLANLKGRKGYAARALQRGEVVLFSMSMAVLMHAFARSRVVQHVTVVVVTEHVRVAVVTEHVRVAVVTEHVTLVVVTELVIEDRAR
ncbi:hypothetical protein CYMTET_54347 [Cymbomonas tetramitiformis]|uniref:Transmembrane protein 135 N-terminal domain-containing protein n=1 Tax=Cymbomonas tetramitiformis TaxID=36881 RepID=A0AAE0BGB0_9CHLO|nr:hypothetical protein CYMTET_54347 [Cymbomonas tetramitiformis]